MALKLHNRKWYPCIFALGCAVVVSLWFCLAGGHRPELLASGIGAVAGFTYFLYRQHLDEKKLFKNPFLEFNTRYDDLNDPLNDIRFSPAEGDLVGEERDTAFSYFNLCAEEHFFYTAGYIDHQVWLSWRRGMKDFFDHPRIRRLWDSDCKPDSYYGFTPPK